jgi:hypothetical protein
MVKRVLTASLLASMLAVASVGAAFAHECVISSRSDQGDAGATHSGRWAVLTLADVLGFINTEIPGQEHQFLTDDQIAWAVANRDMILGTENFPDSWVVRSDKTIGEGSSNPNLGDVTGLDHLADLYGEQVGTLYFAALGQ